MALDYLVEMEGGETYARFQFGADAEFFAKAKSRSSDLNRAVVWAVIHHLGGKPCGLPPVRFQAGKRLK